MPVSDIALSECYKIMETTLNQSNSSYKTFEYIRDIFIPSLNVNISQHRHHITGAEHYHIKSENIENVFLVGFRTVPMDSTGIAHVLEHTVLCGSEKYPVRDPFFMMTRRSLNTFMNAFTSSDWTAYPFATQNKKDFNNLLDVYLDSVFFSRLDSLDFAQEGHRMVFSKENNTESPLVYKGVVYNEMKGALSSPSRQLCDLLYRYLFSADSTYHYNSGGDPESIVDLTYTDLISFYKKHYHPSNSFFMTYGDIPAGEHQRAFEEKVLSRFEAMDDFIEVRALKPSYSPIKVVHSYPLDIKSTGKQSYHVLGWVLGENHDLKSAFKMQILSDVLMDNSSSPLMEALEKTTLGASPAQICGLDGEGRENVFICGIEGSAPENGEKFKCLVISTLEGIAKNGISQEKLEAVLHQFEISQREMSGGGYPYGLKLMLSMIPFCVHRGDVIAAVDIDKVLDELRQDIKDPDFIKNLVKDNLLENQHQVLLTLNPDETLTERKTLFNKKYLMSIREKLSTKEKEEIIELAGALKSRQEQVDDDGILPQVTINDVPTDLVKVNCKVITRGRCKYYEQETNGILYQKIIVNLPKLSDEELNILWLYGQCLPELGAGDVNYMEMQEMQARFTGGFSAYIDINGKPDDENNVAGRLILSGKCLGKNYTKFNELMSNLFNNVRFDDTERLRELVSQISSSQEQKVIDYGHHFAMEAASSGMNSASRLKYHMEGLSGVRYLKDLDVSINESTNLKGLSKSLSSLHNKIIANSQHVLMIGEKQNQELMESMRLSEQKSDSLDSEFSLDSVSEPVKLGYMMNTQVNFCSQAYKTVPISHSDAPILTVIGGILRNGFLHRSIREQGGAYGAGASQDNDNGVLRLYSYRDPRLTETFNDFKASIVWLKCGEFLDSQIQEAILGVISSLDKPMSPAQEASKDYFDNIHGRNYEMRKEFRIKVLKVSRDDIVRVSNAYLTPKNASIAAIISPEFLNECQKLGLDILNI